MKKAIFFSAIFAIFFSEISAKEFRILAYARLGSKAVYPELGFQFQISRNSFIYVAGAFGNAGKIDKSRSWHINSDGSYSPDQEGELEVYEPDPFTYSTPVPPMQHGLKENFKVDFKTISGFAAYQILAIGYKTKNQLWSCLPGAGFSFSKVNQSATRTATDPSGYSAVSDVMESSFISFGVDLTLDLAWEHKSGFGLRAGARSTFGFPYDSNFNAITGTTQLNLFSGLHFNFHAGISFRL